MATAKILIGPSDLIPAATNGPQFKVVDGTNFPVLSLAFDAATEETAHIAFRADDYASGNLTVNLLWYADTASSGDVIWGAKIACITPDTGTQDIETKAFATASTITDSHLGTTGQRLHACSITVSNLDSIAAGDYVALAIYRGAASGSDTMTGDACMVMASVSYTV